jgi:hypothetical protein
MAAQQAPLQSQPEMHNCMLSRLLWLYNPSDAEPDAGNAIELTDIAALCTIIMQR